MLTFLAALAVCAAVAASSWPVVLPPCRSRSRALGWPPVGDPNPWPVAPLCSSGGRFRPVDSEERLRAALCHEVYRHHGRGAAVVATRVMHAAELWAAAPEWSR